MCRGATRAAAEGINEFLNGKGGESVAKGLKLRKSGCERWIILCGNDEYYPILAKICLFQSPSHHQLKLYLKALNWL